MFIRIWRNWNLCASLVKIWNGTATVKNGMAGPQKIKHRIAVWSSSSTSGYTFVKLEAGTQRDMLYAQGNGSVTCESSWRKAQTGKLRPLRSPWKHWENTKTKGWKQSMCPSTDDKWRNKLWSIHKMEYYPALKTKNSNTCYSVTKLSGRRAEGNKPVPGRRTLCGYTHALSLAQDAGCQGLRGGRYGESFNGNSCVRVDAF